MIKKYIPYKVKIRLHLMKRGVNDILNGHFFNYANGKRNVTEFSNSLKIKQDLKPNEAKRENLMLAAKRIEAVQIMPNEIFSFWKAVGNPSAKRGFVESRSLVNGNVEKSIGGGLCQLSGLIYYMSLHANLEILERHNHSIDIYTEETRFTPLGSDATVAYGYKDLKIRNSLNSPINFTFLIEEEFITVRLMHSDTFEENVVEFEKNEIQNNKIEVHTILNKQLIDKSIYKRLEPN